MQVVVEVEVVLRDPRKILEMEETSLSGPTREEEFTLMKATGGAEAGTQVVARIIPITQKGGDIISMAIAEEISLFRFVPGSPAVHFNHSIVYTYIYRCVVYIMYPCNLNFMNMNRNATLNICYLFPQAGTS